MAIIDLGPSINSLANKWIAQHNSEIPTVWTATRADLDSKIEGQVNSCGNYVHEQNWTHNRANGKQACRDKLNTVYTSIIAQVQNQTAQEEAALKEKSLEGNKKTYAIVAIVLLVLVAIVILIKS